MALRRIPDGWDAVVGDVPDDIDESTTLKTGNRSLQMKTSSALALEIRTSEFIPIEDDDTYRFTTWLYASSVAAGRTIKFFVHWYTSAEVFVSTSIIYNAVLTAATTWERIEGTVTAPSTARFAKVGIQRAAIAFDAYIDRVEMERVPQGWECYKSGGNQALTKSVIETILHETKVREIGASYNTGTGIATIDRPGVYIIHASTRVDVGDTYLVESWIEVNGTEIAGGTYKSVNGSNGDTLKVTAIHELAVGDQVEIIVRHQDTTANAISDLNTSFKGVLVKE